MILSPIPKQFVDLRGIPYDSGLLYVYKHGTTELAATYKDSEGTGKNTNPIVLDSRGACQCFVDSSSVLDYVVKDKKRVVVASFYNIPASASFAAEGSDTITVETTTVDGKTTSTFSVAAGSIDKSKLKGTRDLIPDTQYISMERQEGSGEVILSLAAEVPDNDNDYTLKMKQGVMEWEEDSGTADYATEAGHATSADTATSATTATHAVLVDDAKAEIGHYNYYTPTNPAGEEPYSYIFMSLDVTKNLSVFPVNRIYRITNFSTTDHTLTIVNDSTTNSFSYEYFYEGSINRVTCGVGESAIITITGGKTLVFFRNQEFVAHFILK